MEERKEQLDKLKLLQENLDKKSIGELFLQGLQCNVFKPFVFADNLNFQFSLGGFNYTITRSPNKDNKEAMDFIKHRNEQYRKYQEEAKAKAFVMQMKKRGD